jgi:hypothetical protein
MMTRLIKVKGTEYPVPFVRFRDRDYSFSNRSTVTIVTDLSYETVFALFSDPGEWSDIRRYEDGTEIVTDCTGYDRLLSIRDTRTGVLEVVMGKMTDSEILAELLEALK